MGIESCFRRRWEGGEFSKVKDYFEDLYNIDIEEQVGVHMCGFGGVQKSGNYFGGEPVRRTEVEVRVGIVRMKRMRPLELW